MGQLKEIALNYLLPYLSACIVKFRWLGHVLRMEQKRIPKMGLRWNPPGKMKQGRPKMTLRKTFEGDLNKMELTWETTEREAKDRRSWKKRSSCIILNG